MKQIALKHLSTSKLWTLHLEIAKVLEQKIERERLHLDNRLRMLNATNSDRRPYPPVLPKYQNPDRPVETWAGRGKQPRWLVAKLKSGRRLSDFKIQQR
ncbi:histidinol phosphate phosphatase [Bradyrhizobium centrolobii]|uniref:Histidinol phosphate phosphatase n=1 Tax=Bradyrhizobium centrolobii TaxID=1505087 RepID=A0A176Z044_9BRAD|nr:H-NS histone family protein [Bradyrhizobium centrolobii]OAF13604.1 histidinol phosphate phosphatase [Bradyrhizobium centrolobii]